MSGVRSVVKKDFNDALRSRRLLALVALFVLFIVGAEYLLVEVIGGEVTSAEALVVSLLFPTMLLVPLIGLVTGYKAIAGERESGSHKLLLTLPHSRADVVLGKLIGRTAVVFVAILAGFLAGGVVAFALLGSYELTPFLVYLAITLLYALAFVSLGIGISASTGSTSVAVMASFGAFLLFQFLWSFLVGLVDDHLFPETNPEFLQAIAQFSPLSSYLTGINRFLNDGPVPDLPYYQEGWFAVLVLVLWATVPVTVGYLRFRSVDI
ncbi:ABC transporter permease subunit [Halomarina oriensis]|uniref:ABC transporter permease subunit n=1 Tax=Halomarina oriensis TaxID=671145 RepID=A0A6B0GHV2_9EURY|nr:ABC transporter permease subunit [Halomarina oriensis]MWG34314.1 ABC transporter permease subunit [Halomarina oriensis]